MIPDAAPVRRWRIRHARTGQWRAVADGRGRWTGLPQATAFRAREDALDALAALSPGDFAQALLVEEEIRIAASTPAADLLPSPPAVRTGAIPLSSLRLTGDWRAETHLGRRRP